MSPGLRRSSDGAASPQKNRLRVTGTLKIRRTSAARWRAKPLSAQPPLAANDNELYRTFSLPSSHHFIFRFRLSAGNCSNTLLVVDHAIGGVYHVVVGLRNRAAGQFRLISFPDIRRAELDKHLEAQQQNRQVVQLAQPQH